MIPIIVCVLRSGGVYVPEHVYALSRQIRRNTTVPYLFVCYTDMELELEDELGHITLKLEKEYPGWWSCVELWKLRGPVVAVGLDTIVAGNIDDLFQMALDCGPNEFYLPISPFQRGGFINAVQIWNGDFSWLFDSFDYEKHSKQFRGDENYLLHNLEQAGVEIKAIQGKFPRIMSYKKQYNPVKKPGIIYFHGEPRPWQTQLWEKYAK